MQVHGDDNILNVVQAERVTLTQNKIIQISVDEIKTRPFISTSPYKGLRSFEPEDKDRFFGRDQFLANLVNELEQTNLVLLLGASGSGKSSVVRAGLMPWLSQKWGTRLVNLTLTPDQDPFESLYGSLLSRFKQSEAQVARIGQVDTLSQVVKCLKPPDDFWFIFIDQFEELFTVSEPERRDRFITSLANLCKEQGCDR
ncbi:MAG: ATP-binding protein, partial [Cyanobacteria bacterium P01_G01_bin.54]